MPATGGRLIVASDGLWDGFENMKRLCRMSRSWSCQVGKTGLKSITSSHLFSSFSHWDEHVHCLLQPKAGIGELIGYSRDPGNMEHISRVLLQAAPNKIIQTIQRAYGGLRDDTSVVVLDIMPAGVAFTDIGSSNKRQQGSNKGGCFCFSP